MSKITVYENVDFNQVAGKQVEFEIGVHDEDHLAREGIGVNKTSSLKVPEGLQVEVFSGQHYDGKRFIFHYGEYKHLGPYGWHDNIGSLIVKEAPPRDQLVTAYNGVNCSNIYQRFPLSQDAEIQDVAYNDEIKCIHVPVGLTAILYEHYSGGGESYPKIPIDENDEVVNLSQVNFANRCSSIKVIRNPTKVRLLQVEYHLDKKVPQGSKELARVTQTLVNNSANATVQAPVSYSETVGWEISSSWERSLMIGAAVTVESQFNIPIIGKSTVSVSVSSEFTHTWGHNETSSGEAEFNGGLEVELPPKSGAVEAITTIVRESYEVPYTATVEIIATGERREEEGTLLVKNSFDVQTEVKDKQD